MASSLPAQGVCLIFSTAEAIADRRRDDCAGIEQNFGACRAREVLLANRVEAVAVGSGSHPEQPAVIFIGFPSQQRRIFRQELPQTFDVTVMDDASGFGYGPLQSSAEALFYFLDQVLPARKAIFASQHQLGIT